VKTNLDTLVAVYSENSGPDIDWPALEAAEADWAALEAAAPSRTGPGRSSRGSTRRYSEFEICRSTSPSGGTAP
jgi:hypothetical protein